MKMVMTTVLCMRELGRKSEKDKNLFYPVNGREGIGVRNMGT